MYVARVFARVFRLHLLMLEQIIEFGNSACVARVLRQGDGFIKDILKKN